MPQEKTMELEFHLAQVAPGSEMELSKDLLTIPHWQGIGRYDAICVTARDEPEGQNNNSPLQLLEPHALDFAQIRLFSPQSFAPEGGAYKWLSERARGRNWMSLSLLKIAPALLVGAKRWPVDVQQDVATGICEKLGDLAVEFLLLAGYGWHELAVVMLDDRLSRLADAVIKLANTPYGGGPLLLKTFTIFGLNSEFLRADGPKPSEKLENETDELLLATYITCKRGPTSAVSDQLLKKLSGACVKQSMVFGSEDILSVSVSKETTALADFVEGILGVRTDDAAREHLHTTATFIGLKKFQASPPEQLERPVSRLDELTSETFERGFRKLIDEEYAEQREEDLDLKDVQRDATRLRVVLNGCLRNGLTRDAYLDMLPILAHLDREPLVSPRAAKVVLELLGIGYQQRFLGSLNTLWTGGNPVPLFYRAGIQRVLWAIEYLCYSLLERQGSPWHGFVVFGMTRDYFRTHCGILNLPYRAMFDPSEWWGVFHEIGHEHVYQVAKRHGREWSRLVAEAFGIRENDESRGHDERLLYVNEITWEVLADIFDYRFGFHSDWDLYRKVFFEYVIKLAITRTTERWEVGGVRRPPSLALGSSTRERISWFLSRLAGVYWYEKARSEEEFPNEDFINAVVPSLRQAIRETRSLGADGEKLASRAEEVWNTEEVDFMLDARYKIRNILASDPGRRLIELAIPDGQEKREPASSHQGDLKRLGNGEPLQSVPEPETIVCGLLKEKFKAKEQREQAGLPGSARVATILSFWAAYASKLPEIIGQASSYASPDASQR